MAEIITNRIAEQPIQSMRQIAREEGYHSNGSHFKTLYQRNLIFFGVDFNRETCRLMARKELLLYPYKSEKHQRLNQARFNRRLEFSTWYLGRYG